MKINLFIIFAFILLCAGSVSVYAWNSPTKAPPAGGIEPPVTAGINEQIKTGNLGVNGILGIFGNTLFSANLKIADGSQKEFYALVSDSVGNASWKPLPARPVLTHKLSLGDCPSGSTPMTDRGLAYCGYWVNTGAASYCKSGDIRIQAVDTGTSAHKGGNHGITLAEPNGCIGWEGAGNFGGPGCAVLCRTTTTFN